MSRQLVEEAEPSGRDPQGQAEEQWQDLLAAFRESRLYVQVVLSAGLVVIAVLVSAMPLGPLAQVRNTLSWTVGYDYDFAGTVARANQWARGQGGWMAAAKSLWTEATGRADRWMENVAGPHRTQDATGNAGTDDSDRPASPSMLSRSPVLPVNGSIVTAYGWQTSGSTKRFHNGITFAASPGARVVAVDNGVVIRVGQDPSLGAFLEVNHGTVVAAYGRLTGVRVQAGDRVRQGQDLAAVAAPGPALPDTGPQLYFEVRNPSTRKNWDPALYLGLGGIGL